MNREEISRVFARRYARVGKIVFCQDAPACVCAVTAVVLHNAPEIPPVIFFCYQDDEEIKTVDTEIQLRYLGNWNPELRIEKAEDRYLVTVIQETVSWVENSDGSVTRIIDREYREFRSSIV